MFTVISDLLSEWAGLLIVMISAILVTLAAILWILFFRKNAHRRRKRRHHYGDDRQHNPTLAQTGGLPPVREKEEHSTAQTQTLVSQP